MPITTYRTTVPSIRALRDSRPYLGSFLDTTRGGDTSKPRDIAGVPNGRGVGNSKSVRVLPAGGSQANASDVNCGFRSSLEYTYIRAPYRLSHFSHTISLCFES